MERREEKNIEKASHLKHEKLSNITGSGSGILNDVDSFYTFPENNNEIEYCSGTACFVSRFRDPSLFGLAEKSEKKTYCLGKCYLGPASSNKNGEPNIEVKSSAAIVLENIVNGPLRDIKDYSNTGGFLALKNAIAMNREEVVGTIKDSMLRGRGGAGFPTGVKWESVLTQSSDRKYVVVNADEGDAGAYIDKVIMEYDPFKLLEGTVIAGYASGSSTGYIYIRREYPEAVSTILGAIQSMNENGFLGRNILGSDFSFDLHVVVGKGSYVCGEETAMLRAIEGRRPEVSVRPPYPTENGLFNMPTVIDNVETLANVPWILTKGADKFKDLGFSKSRGTKAVSLNSLFKRPGLYEIDPGMSLEDLIFEIGGGLKEGNVSGVIIGGPLAGIVTPDKFSTKLGYEEMHAIGASLGHGGVIAFDEHTSMHELIENVSTFVAFESCGKCTPCRVGSRVIRDAFSARTNKSLSYDDYTDIVSTLKEASLCGLGTGLGDFLSSANTNFNREVRSCFA